MLSPTEFVVMQAAARRILASDDSNAPSPDELEVALHVDAYLQNLDGPLRGDVRALLQLLEHGGGLFRFSFSRFSKMSESEQDATLRDWESSRLDVRRQGFQALRTLAFMGYWRDDKTWPLIGYTGPMVPPK